MQTEQVVGTVDVVMIIFVVLVTNLLNKVLRDMEVVEVMEVLEVKGTVDLLFISGSCSIETVLECTAYFGGGLDDDYDENGSALFFC